MQRAWTARELVRLDIVNEIDAEARDEGKRGRGKGKQKRIDGKARIKHK